MSLSAHRCTTGRRSEAAEADDSLLTVAAPLLSVGVGVSAGKEDGDVNGGSINLQECCSLPAACDTNTFKQQQHDRQPFTLK